MAHPKTSVSWVQTGIGGGFDNLSLQDSHPLPEVGSNDVLVKFHGASLNYRDIAIPMGNYPFPCKNGVVPGSDGAGEVVVVGPNVSRFKEGSKVLTLFNQEHLYGSLNEKTNATGLGGTLDGTFREYGVFNENGLVDMPRNLNYLEGSTLVCAGLTAWNALHGLKSLLPGDYVLTQGTGGVSTFAVQFAKAAGATVIATTSSASKADTLKKLGADHVINYKETPNWGEKAKELTPGGVGVSRIVEIGGPGTLPQSVQAIQYDGIISIIGFVAGGGKEMPTMLDALSHVCTVRGVVVGSREQFESMNRAVESNNLKPLMDPRIFALDELKQALKYQQESKHVGKVCIKIE